VTVPGGGHRGNRKAIGSLLREHLGAGSRGVVSFAGSALVESGFGAILLMAGRTFLEQARFGVLGAAGFGVGFIGK